MKCHQFTFLKGWQINAWSYSVCACMCVHTVMEIGGKLGKENIRTSTILCWRALQRTSGTVASVGFCTQRVSF